MLRKADARVSNGQQANIGQERNFATVRFAAIQFQTMKIDGSKVDTMKFNAVACT